MNLGAAISGLRKKLHINQTDLAKRARISSPYLSMIEAGKRKPTLSNLIMISVALNIKLSTLIIVAEND